MRADLRRLKRETDSGRSVSVSSMGSEPASHAPKSVSARSIRPALWIGAAVVVALIAAGSYLFLGGGRAQISSMAVLPFINANGDPQMEYLSDGISETLINSLSQLPGVRVTARSLAFRYKGKDVDPLKAGRDLNVRSEERRVGKECRL